MTDKAKIEIYKVSIFTATTEGYNVASSSKFDTSEFDTERLAYEAARDFERFACEKFGVANVCFYIKDRLTDEWFPA